MSAVPPKGDLRYPTLGGTIFVGVFLAILATLLTTLLDLGIWPFVVAGIIFAYLVVSNLLHLRMARHQEHARRVVERLSDAAEHERAEREARGS